MKYAATVIAKESPGGMMSINKLLSSLNKVQKTREGVWKACCPAHDDKNPSMGIKLLDDGRILIKCFSGCDVSSIVHSVGMSLEELFPPREVSERGAKSIKKPWIGNDVVRMLKHEITIAYLASQSYPLNEKDQERLHLAQSRILDALNLC